MTKSLSYSAIFTNRKILAIFLLGFASGLPLALSGTTLRAWATFYDFKLSEITILAIAGQAYVFKFLWAPVVDRFALLPIGRRRSWMLVMQILICAMIALQAFFSTNILQFNKTAWLWSMGISASFVALFSATLDLASDAIRNDSTTEEEQSLSASLYVMAYRIAMIVSGGFAIISATGWKKNDILGSILGFSWKGIGWEAVFLMLIGFMALGIVGTLLMKEPEVKHKSNNIIEAAADAMKNFFSREGAIWLLTFMVLYKLGVGYAESLVIPLVTKHLGFTLADYSIITKFIGGSSTILGLYLGKKFSDRFGLYATLWMGGILQTLSLLGFFWLAVDTKSYISLVLVLGLENMCGGIGTMALVSLNMRLTDSRFSATQLALFSAAESITRTYISASSGFLHEYFWWEGNFLLGIALSLPCLLVLTRHNTLFKRLAPVSK